MNSLGSWCTWIPSAWCSSGGLDIVSPATEVWTPAALVGSTWTWLTASSAETNADQGLHVSSFDWCATTSAWVSESLELLTDNVKCYQSQHFRRVCQRFGIKHSFTRPYRPQTNGKAERFIKTVLNEWAYVRRYANSYERAKAWLPWLDRYN